MSYIMNMSKGNKARPKRRKDKMNATTAQFEVGQTYTTRSACDSDCVWAFKVLKRTAKRITVEARGEGVRTVGIRIWEGVETATPLGSYSMAPIIRANRPAK